MIYNAIGRLLPQKAPPADPRRIVFIRPCCIGDAVMATAALTAVRALYPKAHICWAIGSWSARAVAHHPAIDSILDTGEAAMPWRNAFDLLRFCGRLRAGNFDLALSFVRSPLMSLALMLSGIPHRAGLDSGGRGFGYNLRLPVDPGERVHEAAIYLRLASMLARRDMGGWSNLPVDATARESVERRLHEHGIESPYIVAHPGGGSNPGATADSKRYPPKALAALLNRVAGETGARLILIAGPGDAAIANETGRALHEPAVSWVGDLSFAEIGALAADALCYIGNDSGLTHLAAASGAATVMLMGPTDPLRYAPYTDDHLALWRETDAAARDWDWARDGIDPDEAAAKILDYLDNRSA